MLNFIKPISDSYEQIWNSFIEPVVRHLESFRISDRCEPTDINVHLTMEAFYLDIVGFAGRNVLLPHGIADKNIRNFSDIHMFDKVIVSGVAWVDKLHSQGMDKKKIFVGGYPKLDMVQKPNRAETTTVLWAPTHTNSPGSTFPHLTEFMDSLPYPTVISAHPYNRECKIPTFEALTNARVVIADAGSTVYEAWALGIPVVFADWLTKAPVIDIMPGSFEAKIFEENLGFHASNELELVQMVKEAYHAPGIDFRAQKFIDRVFPKYLVGHSGKRIANYLKELL